MKNNILQIPNNLPASDGREFFETLAGGRGDFRIERIISHGQITPEGSFYDQDADEWVLVLEGSARISYDDGSEVSLKQGDALFLPRRVKHRVSYTSSPCLWLAVHGHMAPPDQSAGITNPQ